MTTYDSPLLQALAGLRADGADSLRHMERELAREAAAQRARAGLSERIEQGSVAEAALRALIYVHRSERTFDERTFTLLKELNAEQSPSKRISLAEFKELMRDQYLIVALDEERAVAAIPKLLPEDRAERRATLAMIRRVLAAPGGLSEEGGHRLARIEAMFGENEAASGSSAQLKLPAA